MSSTCQQNETRPTDSIQVNTALCYCRLVKYNINFSTFSYIFIYDFNRNLGKFPFSNHFFCEMFLSVLILLPAKSISTDKQLRNLPCKIFGEWHERIELEYLIRHRPPFSVYLIWHVHLIMYSGTYISGPSLQRKPPISGQNKISRMNSGFFNKIDPP